MFRSSVNRAPPQHMFGSLRPQQAARCELIQTSHIQWEREHVIVSAIGCYVIVRNLLGYIFYIFPIFIRRWEIHISLYRVFHDERAIFWEAIVSAILRKKMYIYTCVLFRTVSLYTVKTSNTPYPHTNCNVHWCWRWNFRKCIILSKLYQLCHLYNKYRF
jgi:hypothetical protein